MRQLMGISLFVAGVAPAHARTGLLELYQKVSTGRNCGADQGVMSHMVPRGAPERCNQSKEGLRAHKLICGIC